MKIGFVFSGQGAQSVGMGKDLFDNSEAAAEIFKQADEVLGWSVSDVCFNGPAEKLTESKYCQPAIYTMSVACLAAFQEKFPAVKQVANGGLSLGEFAALCASGAYSFTDGLKLVAKRGELMDIACKETNGGMASVLGGDLDIIKEVCEQCDIDVANYNCPGQIVISGDKDKVTTAVDELKERGLKRVIPLTVAGAFHSRLMADAGKGFAEVLAETEIVSPEITAMQNFTGKAVNEVSEIKENLVNQVAGSVRWEECVREMVAQGVDTIVEFGPGKVLTGLAKRTDRSLKLFNANSVESIEKFIQE